MGAVFSPDGSALATYLRVCSCLLMYNLEDVFLLLLFSQPIVDAVFSPDGSALATASLDGDVKFFQIDWQETADPPR